MSQAAPNAEVTADQWSDRKRYLWLFGLLIPTFPFLGGGLAAVTGWDIFWYIGPVLILIVIPLIDLRSGLDQSNPPDDLIKTLEEDKYYRWVTYLYLPLQYLSLVWACWLWSGDSLSLFAEIGLALTVGTVAGVGINTKESFIHFLFSLINK